MKTERSAAASYVFHLSSDGVQVNVGPSGDPTAPVHLVIGRHTLVLPVLLAERVVDELVGHLAEIDNG